VTAAGRRLLVDCGLFQGFKQLRLRNRAPFPVDPASLDAVVLTHAHLDHSGYLPLLVKQGYRHRIHCTEATAALCRILLPDSGHLQEEEANHANRHGYSRHRPALPLYTMDDAVRSLERLAPLPFDDEFEPVRGIRVRLIPAGHLLGAAMVLVRADAKTLLFSGDLGRPRDPIMRAPTAVEGADWLIVESTYGDRLHEPGDPRDKLADVVNRTAARGGVIVVPSFAVGRAQALLWLVHLLREERRIPASLPAYLNSPMAADATELYRRFRAEHRLTPQQCEAMCRAATIVNSVEESRKLNEGAWPRLIIAASGMATGGRVLHHLRAFAPDPRNTILLSGFQAGGTRGRALLDGASAIKIFGEYVPVHAEVAALENLSAHADYSETLDWLRRFEHAPQHTFVTHGEAPAADALRLRIEEALSWDCRVPEHLETVELH
jgi:metallo-beta-lactamase family protein